MPALNILTDRRGIETPPRGLPPGTELFAFQAYWASAALLLAIVAYLGWTRGTVAGRRARWAVARSRFTPNVMATAAAGTILFAGIGGYIFYNTNLLNRYQSSVAGQQLRSAHA